MPPISATIITHNEAANIARVIRSLDCADEILVVDSGSTDATVKLATELGARTINHPWEGFAAQKSFAIAQASHEWILSLDADEELNEDARAAIREWKQSTPSVGHTVSPAARGIWDAGSSIRAGIRIGKFACLTAARPDGLAATSMNPWSPKDLWKR